MSLPQPPDVGCYVQIDRFPTRAPRRAPARLRPRVSARRQVSGPARASPPGKSPDLSSPPECVIRRQRQRAFRADLDAVAATDAAQPVDRPLLLRAVHADRARRTFFPAYRATKHLSFAKTSVPRDCGSPAAARMDTAASPVYGRPFQRQLGHAKVGHITFCAANARVDGPARGPARRRDCSPEAVSPRPAGSRTSACARGNAEGFSLPLPSRSRRPRRAAARCAPCILRWDCR